MRKKRGLLFTMESMLALIITLVIVLSAVFALKSINMNAWRDTNLNELGMDYLTLLENDGTLRQAVISSDGTQIKSFLNVFVRKNICAKIKLYDETNSLLLVEAKTGCLHSNTLEVTKRSFVANGDMYYAVFEGWYSE